VNRALLLLGAAGLIALLAWVTLSDETVEDPAGRKRPRDAASRRVVDPGVVETPTEPGDPVAPPEAPTLVAITGTVVDPNGNPLAGAGVSVQYVQGLSSSGTTDEVGRFRVEVLKTEVTVIVNADRYLPHIVMVSPPADLGTIRLDRGSEIHGRVVDSDGVGVAGVKVVTGTIVLFSAETDEDGRFVFKGMPKENFRLNVQGLEVTLAGEAPQVIAPARGVVLTVKRLRMGYGVVVTEDDGKPVAGATVRLTLSSGGWSQVEADEKGRFAFDLTDIRYSDPRLRFTVLVTAGGFEDATVADLTLEQVRPAAKLTVKLIRAVVVEPGRLRGRVLYDTGDPFHGSLTLSFSTEGKAGEIFRIATNEKGEFLVPKVVPGEYVLRSAPHGESILRETGKTLRIPPGGEETTEFTLTRGGDLKLTVTGPDGAAVKEAAVAVLDEGGAERRSFILPLGTAVIPDLVPGKVRIRVSKTSLETAETEVTVVKDQVTDATVRLSEAR